MKTTTTLAALALAATLTSSNAVTIDLFEYGLYLDGTVYAPGDILPPAVGTAGFNFATGLGTLSVALAPTGSHDVRLFVDHEIDESINGWSNESGSTSGSPASGQSWEIDEPGFVFGDIYTHFVAIPPALSLDNMIFNNTMTGPDDVSMALGWNVRSTPCRLTTVYFTLSETAPANLFYLKQSDHDPNSLGKVYFSSYLVHGQAPECTPDAGSTLALLLCACGGLVGWRSLRQSFL